MGPKKPAVSDLAAVAPSEDELKEAREALKKLDGAELKRQKANMAYWLKSRGQEKSAGVRGEDRLRWLEEYFVLKAREKNASRTTSTSHNYAITTKKATKKQWWNKFQLESKLGVERTATLINSGKMQTQACPITGVDDEHNRLYKYSFEEEEEAEKDSLSTALTTNADVKESELDDAIGVMQSARDCMQGTFSVANIKTEPEAQQTEEQKNSAMAAKFTADAKAHVNTLQDKILEMDSLLEQAKDNRHCVTLVDDMTKLKPLFHKALKGVRLIVVNAEKKPDITALAKLQEDVQQCTRDYEDVRKWALKMGLKGLGGGKRQRKA